MNHKSIRILLLLVLPGYLLYSQDTEEKSRTEQIWLDYNPTYTLSEKLDIYSAVSARTVFPNEWYQFDIGTSVRYLRPKLIFKKLYYKEELHFGIKFFFTLNRDNSNRLEIRPFQGYRLLWPNRPKIVIQHFVRLEERFDIRTSDWVNTFGIRLRYMVELMFKFRGDWISFAEGLYLPASMEFFWNLKGAKQFNDVVRITPGIGYEFSDLWKGEFSLSYHYTRNTVEDNFATHDIVFRLRVFHNLSFGKKSNPTKN